ncbi:MAG: hypothetical protein ACI978_002549 [Oleispira sp.]|jgi:hypothetical protein
MSSTSLILIAIITCTICLASLWVTQLKRQRAIEKARKSIIYNAQINQLQQIAEITARFLDDQLIQFLASRINYSAQQLNHHKITPDKRCQHIIEQAQSWAAEPKNLRKQSRKGKAVTQQVSLNLLKSIIQHIREGVIEHQVSRAQATKLANATKLSKIKLSCHYQQLLAKEALKAGELIEGLNSLKKIKALLNKVSPLPSDLQQQLIECQGLIETTQQTLNEQNEQNEKSSGKRLEEEFDKQEEQDNDWQKKQFYDQ